MITFVFFIIVNVIALNVIFGIIIDTFSQLRELTGRKPQGKPVFDKKINRVSVKIHKEMNTTPNDKPEDLNKLIPSKKDLTNPQ